MALAFSRIGVVFYAGFLLAVLAAVLLSPALSLWLARALRPVLKRIRPVEGTLAADSLIQAPRRTSGTVAALMLSLALVISLGGLARASYNSIAEWMRMALNPDLLVTTAENLTNRSFVFPASLARRAPRDRRRRGGADGAQRAGAGEGYAGDADRGGRGRARGACPTCRRWKATHAEMLRLALAGKGVIASENFTRLHGGQLGETIEIPAPSGTLRLPDRGRGARFLRSARQPVPLAGRVRARLERRSGSPVSGSTCGPEPPKVRCGSGFWTLTAGSSVCSC